MNLLTVNLDYPEMIANYKGKRFTIRWIREDSYYYECCDSENRIIAADILNIEELRNGAQFNDLVHWMARGFRGLPQEIPE